MQNKGIYRLFRACEVNETLSNLNISDNQFGQDEDDHALVDQMCKVFEKTESLGIVDIRYNGIYDEGKSNPALLSLLQVLAMKQFINVFRLNKNVYKFKVTNRFSEEVSKEFQSLMGKRKAPKKRKGKKKGKKGKKGK